MRILGKYFGIIWLTIALTVYGSVLVSPLVFEYASIISFAIPVIILISAILFSFSLILNGRYWYIYLITLLIAWPFYALSFELNTNDKESTPHDFRVLSYNVKWFTEANQGNYEEVIDWIIDQDADFLCFQEYYPLKNITARIKQRGGYYDATDAARFNVAFFSKYPVVAKGLLFGKEKLNNVLFADVKIKKDTVRFYSLHLESMGINPEKLQDREGIQNEYEDVKFRILKGSRARAEQIEVLLEHIEKSPYPVIVAGDFNDVPYSFNYFKLRDNLKNAFEEGGRGFGITYNGKIPFLRIDNQFFGDGIELLQFITLNEVKYSDHFPLIGAYRIKD